MRPAALILTLLPLLPIGLPAGAGMPTDLALPIDCRPGEDCWILRYVDDDPGPGVKDYMCGQLAGNGHTGTDIAIRDLEVMARGVEVRAAAAGVVEALRDGLPDISVEEGGRAAIADKQCGNAIRVAHGDDWTTWYCHLRRGSLLVKEGDKVAVGQPLALVGLSGDTSFPHLHFDVRHGDQAVDPFVGVEAGHACGPGKNPLWRADVMAKLAYQPVVLTNAGFAVSGPELPDVVRGWHQQTTLPTTAPALALWVEGYWLAAGDRVYLTVSGPDGAPIADRVVELDTRWAHWFQFVGSRRPGGAWPAGSYTGNVTLERAGIPPVRIQRKVELK